VSAALEAIVELMFVGPSSHQQQVAAVIDTGFNGQLTLPPTIITHLQLSYLCKTNGILANGTVVFLTFTAQP